MPENKTRTKNPTIKTKMLKNTAVLPAVFTLGNAIAGFAAIHFATKSGIDAPMALGTHALHNMQYAVYMMIIATFCDMLDGRVARMTRSTSDFGAQLDSMSDMLSFGVAPAIMMIRASVGILRTEFDFMPLERLLWCIGAIYVACAALRLARFNVETEAAESAHMDFHGLPSPGAAGVIVAIIMFFVWLIDQGYTWLPEKPLLVTMSIILPIVCLLAAILMVSRFRYPHIINQYIRGKRPFAYLVKLLLLLMAVVYRPWPTLAIVAAFFAFYPPLRACFVIATRRKK